MTETTYFHVSSSLNRASIREHGLNWRHMSAAPGIAGSRRPEQHGCFVCEDEREVAWFVRMNNTGGPVDVWTVRGVEPTELGTSPEGHYFVPRPVPPRDLELMTESIPPQRPGPSDVGYAVDPADGSTGLSCEPWSDRKFL